MKRLVAFSVLSFVISCATFGAANECEPRISVFASFIRRIAKERGITKSEAADLLYAQGVRGFDVGPGEADLDELAATRLKPINFYYFPDWFGLRRLVHAREPRRGHLQRHRPPGCTR